MLITVAIGLLVATERMLYGVMGESLTFKVRKELMRGVIYKQLSWFDCESHAPGILTSVFSENVSTLNGMTTEVLCTAIESVLAIIFGLLLGLFFCW